jgi:hypothetical protein
MTVIFKFLNSLRKGYYGLPKTYWTLGVLVKVFLFISLFSSLIFLPILTPLFYGLYMLYVPFYLLGVFNAAKNYNNTLIWKYLAYISASIGTYIYIQEVFQMYNMVTFMKSLIYLK